MAAPHSGGDRPNLAEVTGAPEREQPRPRGRPGAAAAGEAARAQPLLDHRDAPEPPDGFQSTENRTDGLDQNPSSAPCGNIQEKTDRGGPESVTPEKDQIWSALTSSHGCVVPVDWKRSGTRSLYVSMFDLEEDPRETDAAVQLSDEEEPREQLDMHAIIAPCLEEEPLVTAEQVIEEIEEMMQDSPDADAELKLSQSELTVLSLERSGPGFEDRLRDLSVTELLERLKETEVNIRRFSEELVKQLAVRDELDFEKEVKNSFISALIDVQNRQKEHREKKKKRLKGGTGPSVPEKTPASRFSMEGISSVIQNSFRQTFGSGCSERQYLTTVIPYEKKGRPPSAEDLQILTKILQAMRDDSDKVPGLLTDYILNVFCPT